MNFEETLARRDYLKLLAKLFAASLSGSAPLALADTADVVHPAPKADTCILLWMAGGMAATETFDPKHYVPFKKGVPVEEILSTFPAIDTTVDEIKLTKGLEGVASIMDRGTLLRSHVQADLGHILHSRHQYHWHTGYVPPQTVAAPHMGAWMSKVLGPNNSVMPPFISIGQPLTGGGAETQELKAFLTGGFFGFDHGPFHVPNPSDAASVVRPAPGVTPDRFANRYRRFRKLIDASPNRDQLSGFQYESIEASMENAYRLLNSPDKRAFDIDEESAETKAAYGKSHFGQGCLLARRLVESGARFIEVTNAYKPFGDWDTHKDGHTTTARLKTEIDPAITQLVLDLEQRDLLDRTLIIVASEFSRDMMTEGRPGSNALDQSLAVSDKLVEMKHYGMHRHWTAGSSVLMFGGGVKRGCLYGATAEERPILADKPVTITDLHATIYTAMGINPKTAFLVEKRPFYVTEDGHGKPVMELFG
ncbi:MAG: DUF1501 domain-containing protein [Rhizobiaceae bacterium]